MNTRILHIFTRTTLRGEFQRQAQGLKKAVLDGDQFQPFIMN